MFKTLSFVSWKEMCVAFHRAIDLLIEYGADVNYTNHAGKTA